MDVIVTSFPLKCSDLYIFTFVFFDRIYDTKTMSIGSISARNKDQELIGRFLKIRYFIGYYTAVPLKMYRKFGRSK